jgi:putative transposase
MTNRRVIDEELYAHFVTFSVYRRRRLFEQDEPKRIFLGTLTAELETRDARCIGFVIMPDHIHLIVWFAKTGELSRFIQSLKRKSSYRIRNWFRKNSPGYHSEFGEGDHFWQPKYYSFEIHNHSKLEEKLDYIHLNPVRAGLVDKAIDWRWSSARKYILNRTVGVPIKWVD